MKKNMTQMMSLDIYLDSLSKKNYQKVKKEFLASSVSIMPLESWNVHIENFHELQQAQKRQNSIDAFKEIAKKYQWKNEIDELFVNKDFEALILTDSKNEIQWVNDGFTEMTGYSKNYAMHKNPKFLQGKDTDPAALKRIRKQLSRNLPFKEVLLNYKKNSTPYNCEISVIPLATDKTTHFLALEREIA
ncbi:PAS domain S-box-containing protein [Salegentibacter echinorum]|uniref:PAS domain S-box-containing protein n=1 Tax=Salegentibacter echinorum TaxID=1073325 RepID=A0A1M5JUB4_SALEC|nr:PAS domain-containing protein [Salegentibacter echinorum]SHG44146.1 PAS domain S-box-containing protein [Salegentibacter echinorum]